MANFHLSSRKRRGPQPSNLSVRLFLLDPDKKITKVTRETCSKGGIEHLMQKGCGPPQPEHCVSDDKVEFLFELTNEQFKQKLVEIYPKLENACFVFMKADKNNKLEELNRGMCCFRCYTPENVYHSERGQGRLYIQKIAESEISQCTHGVSLVKRLCVVPGHSQQRFVPIQPKLLPAVCPITGIESRPLLVTPGAMPALDLSSTPTVLSSGNILPQSQLLSSAIFPQTESTPPVYSTVNVATQSLLSSAAISQTTSSQPVNVLLNSSVNIVPQDRYQQTLPAIVTHTTSSQPVQSSGNMVTQNQLQPPSNMFSQSVSRSAAQIPVNMVLPNLLPTSTSFVPGHISTSLFDNYVNMVTQNQLPAPVTAVSWTAPRPAAQNFVNTLAQNQVPTIVSATAHTPTINQLPTSTSFAFGNALTSPFQDRLNMMTRNQLHTSTIDSGSMARQGQFSRSIGVSDTNFEQLAFRTPAPVTASEQDIGQLGATFEDRRAPPMTGTDGNVDMSMLQESVTGFQMTNVVSGLHDPSTASNSRMTSLSNPPDFPASSNRWIQSPGLVTLVDAIDTVQRGDWIPTNANISNDQGNLDLQVPVESLIDSFLENVKSTGKLEISSFILDNRVLMEKLNASTINIHTVEIESTCKLHQAIKQFSLPSCLTVLRINDNNLNYKDVFALLASLRSVNGLDELDLSRTKFQEISFSSFVSVLISCTSLRKLCLVDNGLTKEDMNCLNDAFESLKNLINLNLSKNNLTETQANDILQKVEGKSIVSLNLSQNALQGNEIIVGICQLQSLQELNLSSNHIRFFPLPDLEKQRDHLPINTTIISLSSNHMTDKDICRFVSLVRSDLLKLNLDFNHVGSSIWSLCSLRVKHLKVLSLENTDIRGPAVQGLAFLLSLVGELEELNLSSNNLVLADFQELQPPLSNLTQLKRLNLSNNPYGISVILLKIMLSLKYLEELRLSNVHLNGDDLNEICDSLASLKVLKHLDLSMNTIGPDGTRALANILKEFPLLEGLNMSKSCIKEDEISVLCKGLVSSNRLKYLNLSGNRLAIEVIRDPVFLPPMLEELIFSRVIHGGKLFSNISLLQHLRKLHLSEINLRPCDVEELTAMLSSFPLLEELVLAKTACTDCEKIFSAIKSLKNIKKIDLTGIKISDGNAFAEMLSSLLSLEELVLTDISFAYTECNIILSAIKSLKKLKTIDLTGIKIADENAIAEMLSSLLSLEELVLANRRCVYRNDEIFSKIKLLKNLRKLDLDCIRPWDIEACFDMLSSLSFLEDIVFPHVDLVHADDITGCFSALKSFRYLRNLNLRVTYSMAEYFARVVPSLQLLEKLVLVNVDNGDIDNESEKQLFGAIGKLTYLKELKLMWCTQATADSLAEVLLSLQLLEKLVFSNDGSGEDDDTMDDLSGKQLFAAVGKLKYLKEFELHGYKIVQADADSLAEVLPSLQLLEKLVLRFVDCADIDDESEKQLFTAVGKLTYLKELDFLLYMITQAGVDSLAEVLPSLQLLEKLVLSNDYGDVMDDLSGKQLFDAVGKLTYLKKLKLGDFMITQADADTLDEVLPSLQLLEKLVFSRVGFESAKELFATIGKLTYLKELKLDYCTITQADADSLAEVLLSLQLLEKLSLVCNDFTNIKDHQLFSAVGSLSYLTGLCLCHTKITNAGAEILIDVLPSLRNLTYIKLNGICEPLKSRLMAAVLQVPGLEVR